MHFIDGSHIYFNIIIDFNITAAMAFKNFLGAMFILPPPGQHAGVFCTLMYEKLA